MAPRQSDTAETRARIIQAALECFSRTGYNQTTMDDVVAASGVSKGTLYWHFKNKEDLLESAIRALFEEYFGADPLAHLDNLPTASDKLRAVAQEAVEASKHVSGMFNLFIEYWTSSSQRERADHVWFEFLLEYKSMLVSIIEAGISAGEFKPTDAEALAWSFLAAYDGLAAYVMLKPDIDLAQISATFVDTLLQGLEAEK
jgi:AcrR family transcriptional regulator